MLPFKDNQFYKEKSVLTMDRIVAWNKKNNTYNFECLPETAIISLSESLLERKKRFLSKKLKGIFGNHYIVSPKLLFCSDFGIGAPAVIGLMEILKEFGVKNFIFIGFAGSLIAEINEGQVLLIKKSFSTTGSTSFYSPNIHFELNESTWCTKLRGKLNLKETIGWSTDAPFRETYSLINYFLMKEVTLVDMECAAIYAMAEFYNLNAICVVVNADNLSPENWQPPQNRVFVRNSLKGIIKKTIQLINE